MKQLIILTMLCKIIPKISTYGTDEPNAAQNELLQEFFERHPDLYAKVENIERMYNKSGNHNTEEIRKMQEAVLADFQPRMISEAEGAVKQKLENLQKQIFIEKKRTITRQDKLHARDKILGNVTINSPHNNLMEITSLLISYRQCIVRFFKMLSKKGVENVIETERIELERRIKSYMKTEDEIKASIVRFVDLENVLTDKYQFCGKAMEDWLESHFIEVERLKVIEQHEGGTIPLEDNLMKKILHQCMLFITIQQEYLANSVNKHGTKQIK